MSDIKVIQLNSQQVQDYKERKYKQFLKYYMETDLQMKDIFKLCGFTSENSTVKYIRCRLRDEGYNSLSRFQSIRKGEWL